LEVVLLFMEVAVLRFMEAEASVLLFREAAVRVP
jgi:hypothetical protein